VSVFAHMRRMLLPLAIVVAIVAIAVPTCQMINCDMDMSGGMPFVPFSGTRMSADCPGEWAVFTAPASTLPGGSDSLLITLLAAIVAAVVLLAPQLAGRPVLVRVSNPPPPPEEPRGERFRV
jgi:hypothetical protein